jgi:hypothetical protein
MPGDEGLIKLGIAALLLVGCHDRRASTREAPAASATATAAPTQNAPGSGIPRGRIDFKTRGDIQTLRIDRGALVFCESGTAKRMELDGSIRPAPTETCVDAGVEPDWDVCDQSERGPIAAVRRPGLGPDDVVDLAIGPVAAIRVPGHLETCVADAHIVVLGGSTKTVAVDLDSGAQVVLSEDGAHRSAVTAEWIAWSGLYDETLHLRRRADVVAQAVLFPEDGGVPAGALAEADRDFVDPRRGWGWSDLCFRHLKAFEASWALGACAAGLKLADADPNARAALVFNEGLVAEQVGAGATAIARFRESLRMRAPNDPSRRQVAEAIRRIQKGE